MGMRWSVFIVVAVDQEMTLYAQDGFITSKAALVIRFIVVVLCAFWASLS